MTIAEARKILNKDVERLTDEQVQEYIDSASVLTDIFFDIWDKMTLEEKQKWKKKSSVKYVKG